MFHLPAQVRQVTMRGELQNDHQLGILEERVQVFDDRRMVEGLQEVDLGSATATGFGVHVEDLDPLQGHLDVSSRLPPGAVHLREVAAADGAHDFELLDAVFQAADVASGDVQEPLRVWPLPWIDREKATNDLN